MNGETAVRTSPVGPPDELAHLVALYSQTGDEAPLAQLAEASRPLIRSIIKSYRNGRTPPGDLEQIGYLGLFRAVKYFDRTRGARFAAYASCEIHGELRHYFRDQGWLIRQKRNFGRLGLKPLTTVSLSTPVGDDLFLQDVYGSEDPGLKRVEDSCDYRLLVGRLQAMVTDLPWEQQQVILLFGIRRLTNKEVGRVIGRSPRHVRRLWREGRRVLQERRAATI